MNPIEYYLKKIYPDISDDIVQEVINYLLVSYSPDLQNMPENSSKELLLAKGNSVAKIIVENQNGSNVLIIEERGYNPDVIGIKKAITINLESKVFNIQMECFNGILFGNISLRNLGLLDYQNERFSGSIKYNDSYGFYKTQKVKKLPFSSLNELKEEITDNHVLLLFASKRLEHEFYSFIKTQKDKESKTIFTHNKKH